ncbi:MAG TPA: transglycosylase domain-containing protein, partial [Vampirovibrionales bacterium]
MTQLNKKFQNLLDNLNNSFVKAKPVVIPLSKYLGIAVLAVFIGWFLLNLLIVPINRLFGLPDVTKLQKYAPISSIEVYDKNDQFVAVLQGEENRQIIPLSKVSSSLRQALLASEDRDFYQHGGINFIGIFRAMLTNLKEGRLSQGGSTLTQQLAKNIFFEPKDWGTINRKIKEMFIALELERKYTKEQILELYFNQVYWGQSSYGVQSAAQKYFNKDASDLNIAESAYLVALLPSPSTLHKTAQAFKLQRQLIHNMRKYEYINDKQLDDALSAELKFKSSPGNLSKYPFYMSVVLDELKNEFKENELRHYGLKVYTSLDPLAQEEAEQRLKKGIKNAPRGINQGALVTIDVQTSEARAIVGGVGDFWAHQWNRATSVHTIGSAFKPFVYLTAFSKGICSSSSTVMDSPFVYVNEELGEVWKPKNFDKKFWGPITVRKALVSSRNIPSIRIAEETGIENVVETAKRFGLEGVEPYLSSALGSSALSPLKVANAYAAISRGGVYSEPIIIRKIIDSKRKTIFQHETSSKRVFPSAPINELLSVMTDVVAYGTGVGAKIPGLEIAGKTGTADGSRDVWFVGFTPDTVTVLWGGNEDNKEASSSATGGSVLAGIWKSYMQEYYKLNPMPVSHFPQAPPKVKVKIDPISGLLATKSTFHPITKELVKGTEPKKYAPNPSA